MRHSLTSAFALSFLLAAGPSFAPAGRSPSFGERVAAQRAIEQARYRFLIGARRSFDTVLTDRALAERVVDSLRQSSALEVFWGAPVTRADLEREMARIESRTLFPERLAKIYEALGNDRDLVLETFVRATLVDRRARALFSADPGIHAEARRKARLLRAQIVEGRAGPLSARQEGIQVTVRDRDEIVGSAPGWMLRGGRVEAVEERGDGFVIRQHLTGRGPGEQVVTYTIPKRPWDVWWVEARREVPAELPSEDSVVRGTQASLALCLDDDVWVETTRSGAPAPRSDHSAVWTGDGMIVWGGDALAGGLYDPITDSWRSISTLGQPQARAGHSAVWTGDEMIVWGGIGFDPALNTGGRYDPIADSWTATSVDNAPQSRFGHPAVWTGTEMIVWGGATRQGAGDPEFSLDTGGRYDPVSDAWTPTAPGPSRRRGHGMVWTGLEVIVWGGYCLESIQVCPEGQYLSSGGVYDPSSNSWRPTSNIGAPSSRTGHSSVWTGTEMIVWGGAGGFVTTTGGRYRPDLDSWHPTSQTGSPIPRSSHSAVWTGKEMIVWGGRGGVNFWNTGGRYDPATDAWRDTSLLDAPSPRSSYSAVWADEAMIVWGGVDHSTVPSTSTDDGRVYGTGMVIVDTDGDGFLSCVEDCDDTDPTVYPGAPQVCDGVNNDCESPIWPALEGDESDDDGDGLSICAGDCDDAAPTVYPGAPQVCDGVNNDCESPVWPALEGAESDGDGDGFSECAGDCDDTDPLVNPQGFEVFGNTTDEDCDGTIVCDPRDFKTEGQVRACVAQECAMLGRLSGRVTAQQCRSLLHDL